MDSQSNERKLIILDEISRVKEWEFALKYIIDVYSRKDKTFILPGSSSWDIKHSVERLPGRKGELSGEQILRTQLAIILDMPHSLSKPVKARHF